MLNFKCRIIPGVIAIVICSLHGHLCNFQVSDSSHRHSQAINGSVFWNKWLRYLKKKKKYFCYDQFPHNVYLFLCTKGNYALFSKKASVAADISTLAQSPSRAIQAAHKYFSQPVQSWPVPDSFDKVFKARIRLLCTRHIWHFHGQ